MVGGGGGSRSEYKPQLQNVEGHPPNRIFLFLAVFQKQRFLHFVSFGESHNQGRQEGEAEGTGSREPCKLLSKFLVKASLDVFKEPPNRIYKDLRVSDSPDCLAFCPFCSLRSQTQGASFAVLPLGLESLPAALLMTCTKKLVFSIPGNLGLSTNIVF